MINPRIPHVLVVVQGGVAEVVVTSEETNVLVLDFDRNDLISENDVEDYLTHYRSLGNIESYEKELSNWKKEFKQEFVR